MSASRKNQNSIIISVSKTFGFLLLVLCAVSIVADAQTETKKARGPLLQDYRGIKIGMTASEVRAKLGKAQSDDKDGFMYVFPDDETAQIVIDDQQKVRTVSVMYGGDCPKPLKFEDIFGKDIEPEKQAGGALYKMMKYADAGYWVSYNRMAGDKPSTLFVMQRIQ